MLGPSVTQPAYCLVPDFFGSQCLLLLGQLNHVRVSGTTHLLEIKGLFEPLDLLESLGQGELFEVNLGLLEVSDNKLSSI